MSMKNFTEDFSEIGNVFNALCSVRFGKKYMQLKPVNSVRETRFIIYNNVQLDEIKCDDNGAYVTPSTKKKNYSLWKN